MGQGSTGAEQQAAATTTSPPLLQCHPDVWAQVLLPKLVAQGSAGSVALTCSRLRDVCYSSVQQLNVVVVHESMLAYTFRTVRSWGLSLQAHFPGCTSISVGLGCAFDCGFVIQLIPGLARLPKLNSIVLTVDADTPRKQRGRAGLVSLLRTMRKHLSGLRSLSITSKQGWQDASKLWSELAQLTQLTQLSLEFTEEVVELAIARQAVQARRAAVAAAAAGDSDSPSPAEAAAEAMQQARRAAAAPTPPAAAAAAAEAEAVVPAAAAPGTHEWVDEWAPQASQQQQQRPRRRQPQGRSAQRGRGRSSRSNRQHHNGDVHVEDEFARNAAAAAGTPTAVNIENTAAAAAAAAAVTAAGVGAAAYTIGGVYAGLASLPPGLAAALWGDVAASSLPEGEDSCCICTEGFTEELEGGGMRLVTQLHCRHTYCVLCLRQLATNQAARQQPLYCPQCRAEV